VVVPPIVRLWYVSLLEVELNLAKPEPSVAVSTSVIFVDERTDSSSDEMVVQDHCCSTGTGWTRRTSWNVRLVVVVTVSTNPLANAVTVVVVLVVVPPSVVLVPYATSHSGRIRIVIAGRRGCGTG